MSAGADGGSGSKRAERDDTTWAAFDDPDFLGEDFSSVKPENVGRAKSRVSAADRAAFLEQLEDDPDMQLEAGEHHAWDPEAWPAESSRVKAMPHWMMMQYAQSELESDAEGTDFEDNSKLHAIKVKELKRDAQGRAGAYGGRKTSSAYAWVKAGDGGFSVNRTPLAYYFSGLEERKIAMFPLIALEACGGFDVTVFVRGGGVMGQARAVRNAVARALAAYDPYLKPVLKKHDLLKRDPRTVERKKPGQKKARKKFQWVKR